ncbi:MAG: ABC transporter permease [Bacteroidales bacterium]|jgi:ABC-type multidrug transport system permease subunit|nr:ABC transporter permease [Bacteroidales bacterium]
MKIMNGFKLLKNNQLYQLTITHFLETIREPSVLFWGILFPVLLSIGMGLAFTQSSESKFRIMIVENNPTKLDSLLQVHGQEPQNENSNISIWKINDNTLGNTIFSFIRNDWKTAIVALKRGDADVIITDSLGEIQYHFDPKNTQAQLIYMKLSALLDSKTNEKHIVSSDTNIKPLTLKGVRYIDFLIPGLIAFGMMSSILWGISYSIIDRRSQKLLRRMVATPMKKYNLLIAMMLVRTLMNFIEAAILFFVVWLLFDIQIQGNIGALFVLFLAGNIAFTGIAVLISCRTSKTEVGNGLINTVQLPMMILSGIFFSYQNFPQWSIGTIKLLPLTAITDGMRSIFNEGAGWLEIITPSISLSVFGIICFVVGIRLFKWY